MNAPWTHQPKAVAFARMHRKVAFVHDCGLGKSRTAVMLANDLQAKRMLVLCPAIATEHWARQVDFWIDRDVSITIMRSMTNGWALTADVVIAPYSLLSTQPKAVKRLAAQRFDLVAIDEAHALKDPDSLRTQVAYRLDDELVDSLVANAPHVVLLTATLECNHPAELWTHLAALRPELLAAPGYDSFVERYCKTRTVWRGSTPHEQITGALPGAPVIDLKRRLSTFVHRVRKKDVQRNLPPVQIDTWPVHVDDLAVPAELLREWRMAEGALMRDVGSATGEEALALAKASPHAATQRRLTGVIKIAAVTALLEQELAEPGRKVIVFSYHRAVVEAIEKKFWGYGVVTLDGRTPQDKRDALATAFRNDPKKRLLNGQINVAGESIDLTGPDIMWIVENDWTPKTITQAIGRANRPGQTLPLTVRMLVLAGSIDDGITRTLARKTRDIGQLIDA